MQTAETFAKKEKPRKKKDENRAGETGLSRALMSYSVRDVITLTSLPEINERRFVALLLLGTNFFYDL